MCSTRGGLIVEHHDNDDDETNHDDDDDEINDDDDDDEINDDDDETNHHFVIDNGTHGDKSFKRA